MSIRPSCDGGSTASAIGVVLVLALIGGHSLLFYFFAGRLMPAAGFMATDPMT
ncbi:MAG: hypothetical protein ACLFM0_04770 [Spirochaetales bacterium]